MPAEQDLRRFFDTAPVGMYRSSPEGRFVFVNRALVQLLGYATADEVLALDLARDIYENPADRARLIANVVELDGRPEGVDVRWKTRAGGVRTIRLYMRVVRDAAGAPLAFDTTAIDVTELHEALERNRIARDQLEHTATTLGLLLAQIPAVLWTTDAELRVTSSGGAVQELLGAAPNAAVGTTLFEQVGTTDPDHPVIVHHRNALAGEVIAYDNEFQGKTFTARVGPQRAADGTVIGTIGAAIDVTAGRALERRMVDAQRAESLGVLAGGLAHDFNNLLVAILGNADLALRDPPGSHGALDNIRTAAMRAAELTHQLLAYAGGGHQAPSSIGIAPLCAELLALLAPTTPAGVTLRDELPADLPAVRADPSQLRQVILNLVTNAREAVSARGGEVRIGAAIVDHDGAASADDVIPPAPGRHVVLAVTDDGQGIDPAVRTRIFEPFFTTKATGHGLGLAAVLGIVRSHGGGLRAGDNASGAGARFEVWWPAPRVPAVRTPTPAPVARQSVLVVDDEDMVRDVLARMVEDLGYQVTAVADGPAALALADHADVELDAVILDLTMPAMGGRAVLAAMRERRPGLPIILCSGYERERDAQPAGDAFLRKPFRIEELEQVLRDALRR
jgi:PAS domain S-box-containing protein